jgi:hypothetical protein
MSDWGCSISKWDFGDVVISREEIKRGWVDEVVDSLGMFTETPDVALEYMEKVGVSFYGYTDIGNSVWEMKEVRDFICQIDERFPYWLFFMNKFCEGLEYIYLCKMPPVLTREERTEIFPRTLARLMNSRWLPAMREMAEYAGLNEGQIECLADRSVSYFIDGPLRMQRDRKAAMARCDAAKEIDEIRYSSLLPMFQLTSAMMGGHLAQSREPLEEFLGLLRDEFDLPADEIRDCKNYIIRFFEEEVSCSGR